jgi:hypothetical protein
MSRTTGRWNFRARRLLLARPSDETIEAVEETNSRMSCREAETGLFNNRSTNFGGRAMSTKKNLAKYLILRTAAFVGLTAASTAVMALPYLA